MRGGGKLIYNPSYSINYDCLILAIFANKSGQPISEFEAGDYALAKYELLKFEKPKHKEAFSINQKQEILVLFRKGYGYDYILNYMITKYDLCITYMQIYRIFISSKKKGNTNN